jgi:hypothetical protein
MERWASIDVEDVHLATIRIYHPPSESPNQKPRIVLFLPPNHDPTQENGELPPQKPKWPVFEAATTFQASGPEPDCYELDMVNDNVENQIVVAERPKDPSLSVSSNNVLHNTRARTTILTGRIKHECNLRPALSKSYRKQMKERVRKSNTPLRQIRMIEDAGVPGGRGGVNRLSSGVGMGAGAAFSDLTVCFMLTFKIHDAHDIAEKETEAGQGHVRAYGPDAQKPVVGQPLYIVSGTTSLGYTYPSRKDTATGGLSKGDPVSNCVSAQVWRVQWFMGTAGEL